MKLFGTDDLSQIFSGLADRSNVISDVPNFETVLLSHGVDPRDIEGPLVQPPEFVAQIRKTLDEDTTGQDEVVNAHEAHEIGEACQSHQAPQAGAPVAAPLPVSAAVVPRAQSGSAQGSGVLSCYNFICNHQTHFVL